MTFGELTREGYSTVESERFEGSVDGFWGVRVGILDGDGVRLTSCFGLVFGVNSTRLMVGGRCSEDGKAPGRAGRSLSRFIALSGAGR